MEDGKRVATAQYVKGNSGTGAFISGIIFGVMSMLFVLVGLGIWVTNGVTIKNMESWFGFNINLGDDPSNVKSMSIIELIGFGSDLANNMDTLTIDALETNFGISFPDDFMGIDITPIKSVPVMQIGNNLNLVVDGITLNNISNILDMKLPNIPIINDNSDVGLSAAIENIFGALNMETMTVGTLQQFGIDLTTIDVLAGVPATTLISDLSKEILNKTVGELLKLAPDVSGIMKLLANEKISDIPNKINNYTIGQILDLKDPTGLMGALANLKVSEMNMKNIQDIIVDLTLVDILPSSSFDDTTSILYKLKDSKISNLDSAMNNLKVSDFFVTDSGIMKLIDPNTTILELPNALANVLDMQTLTFGKLAEIDPTLKENIDKMPAGWAECTIAQMIELIITSGIPAPKAA